MLFSSRGTRARSPAASAARSPGAASAVEEAKRRHRKGLPRADALRARLAVLI